MFKSSVRYFVSIVEHGSIRAAADALHIAQSAVSRQLQSLEHELGAPLVERHARGVVLTEAGEILIHYLRRAGFHVQRIRAEIDALNGLQRGHVSFATVESLIGEFVPRVISRFRASYPGITLAVTVAGSDRVLHAVRYGEADLGIAFNQELPAEIEVASRLRERIFAVMAPDHPLASSGEIAITDCVGWPIGLSPRWTGTRQLAERVCVDAGVALDIVLESNSIELLHRFALSGEGIAFLTGTSCASSVAAGKLVAVPIHERGFEVAALEILHLAGRHLPAAADAFLQALCGTLREQDTVGGGPAVMPVRHQRRAGNALPALSAR